MTCELEVEEVKNWMPSKRKKREVSEFEEEIAKFMMRDYWLDSSSILKFVIISNKYDYVKYFV